MNFSKALLGPGRSALFVLGKHGKDVTPAVTPELDIVHRLGSEGAVERMKSNLKARRMKELVDVDQVLEGGRYLEWIEEGLAKLEIRRAEVRDAFAAVADETPDSKAETEDLKTEARDLRKSIKGLTADKWKVEETTIFNYLALPNDLDPATPRGLEAAEVHVQGQKPSVRSPPHFQICADEIEFTGEGGQGFRGAYLKGRLAQLELDTAWSVQTHLLEAGMEMASGPDLARSCLLEGCDPASVTLLESEGDLKGSGLRGGLGLSATSDFGDVWSGSGTSLTGSGSLQSAVGGFVKHIICNPAACLPICHFTLGRLYSHKGENPAGPTVSEEAIDSKAQSFASLVSSGPPMEPPSLFNLQQSSVASVFSASRSRESADLQKKFLYRTMVAFFERLPGHEQHFRVLNLPAAQIDPAASSCLSFQLYSPWMGDYVEVGHLACYDDFISRRLMLVSEDSHTKALGGLFVLHGTFLNITRFIGCHIENSLGVCS